MSEISPAPDAVPSLSQQLTDAVGAAISAAYPEQAGADPLIRPSDHADLQANAALALAKKVGANPREVAATVTEQIPAGSAVGSVEISGPGFLNLTLSDDALWAQVEARRASDRLGVPAAQAGVRTVIDYSGPNIAKEMHVGHIRSTVIGDALVRVLGFLGSDVIKQNHLGDWGTQFGMLIQYITEHPEQLWRHSDLAGSADATTVSALDALYKAARKTFDADEAFADRARARVVALQAGDEETLSVWKEIVAESEFYFDEVYARLGILLRSEDSRGESSYNTMLDGVAAELEQAGIAEISDGALVVLSEDVKGPDDQPAALMVRKRDGGYGYDTTDLATLKYRISELEADRILYLVDARQTLHFRLLFEAGRRAGWLSEDVDARHISFGSILGPDGKPFKTRSGETVRLMDLLDMAVAAAATVVREGAEAKGSDLDEAALTEIAEQAGIGAVKYADLSGSRTKDYVFDPERMTAFNGNTGVYLQYAHTRMVSILRRAGERGVELPDGVPSAIDEVALERAERALVLANDGLGDVLAAVAEDLEPHRLTTYLYELSRAFTDFYEACPVLASEGSVRERRLALVDLTRRTLAQGLDLLGIAAPERM
ncbi:arginine--tRNA ligase [Ruania halotolerans]|uniref:arginine--tRNA ligase n=1 Tax=Ruania halotolerans TaxID=2897773 RepID=UPI001E4EAAF9|nr:arginine--tRNA ligase [Ruania halotolerans]UFU06612.1 arginine--tRNA ligase [Ruania halotolerans]